MSAISRLKKSKKSSVLSLAEESFHTRVQENQVEDLEKISVIWSAMLDLETPMLPSQAAALLSAAELVRATTLVDSEQYWVDAAVFAIIAAHSDESALSLQDEDAEDLTCSAENSRPTVGFSPATRGQ
jgi:hypothetical protein